jgi:acyl-CoA synthetase (AMP-forming)/AMP-acid ligase II
VNKRGEENFAGRLVGRLGEGSCLIDAAKGETISGAELPRRILGFAAGFLGAGLRPGDRLLVSCSLSPASTLAYLGAMYAGIVPVPIEERLLTEAGEALCIRSGAKAVWTARENACAWAEKIGVRVISQKFEGGSADSLPPADCAKSDLAALMPTSGSTGVPRLVMVSHGNLITNTEAIVISQNLKADERAMLIMPISYCFGASVMHTHLYQGGGVVFDSRFMFPDKVLHAVNEFQCTTFAGVPIIYNILLRRSNLRSIGLPGLRRFLQAGGPLAGESVREMCEVVAEAEFFVMYGQTEATARISCLPAKRLPEKLGSVGLPLDDLEIRLMNEMGRELAHGQSSGEEVAEIQVRGPSVCAGYWNDPDASARKFVDGWLRTGDFASSDRDGFLWIKGRTDDFIKIRGVRVSVGEVEARVGALAGVSECAAVGVKHPEAGEALALLVVAEKVAAEQNGDGLGERVRRALPSHWTCVSVKVVAELPRTSNGKIARAKLPPLVEAAEIG